MADNSLDSLVEWMKTADPLRGWGMILALERDAANRLLLNEHISRFGSAAHVPLASGDVSGFGDTLKQRISQFVLGSPVLSFEHSRLSMARATLSLPVTGGSHLTWKKQPHGKWLMMRMAFYDPLQGPSLSLELNFAEEPTTVAADARLYLDLSSGANYQLSFADTEAAQALGGAFFEVLFMALSSAQVEYAIGRLRATEGSTLVPERFRLAAQAKWSLDSPEPGQNAEEGAWLALVQLAGAEAGTTPGADDYHYLIPEREEGRYSSTVLFDRASGPVLPGGEIVLERLFRLLGGDESNFDIQRTNGELIKATATSGVLSIAETATRFVPLKVDGQWVQAIAYTPAVNFPATGATPLTLERQGEGKYSLKWTSPEQTATSVIKFDHTWPDQQKQTPYTIELDAVFEQLELDDGSLEFRATTFITKGPPLPGTRLHERGRPGGVEAIEPYLMLSLIHYGTVRVNAALRSGLSLSTESRRAADDLIDDANALVRAVIEFNAGTVYGAEVVKHPRDVACIGDMRPGPAEFTINPLELRMLAGTSHTFTTSPAFDGLNWAAVNAAPEGGPAGEMISSSGVYTAPDAAAITGQYTWVRVTATAGSVSHSALASVVVEPLTVSPLFTQCTHDTGPILLRAGQVGAGELVWAISSANPEQCGTLEDHKDGTCTYQPHPLIADAYFVVDEVTVTAMAVQAVRSSVVLVEHNPKLEISYSAVPVTGGETTLSATRNGRPIWVPQWSVELDGPGRISTSGDQEGVGRYVADIDAPDRFVLIKVVSTRWQGEMEVFTHYVALPLPLANFSEQLPPSSQPAQVTP
jgi:hypothetical protein